MESSNLYSQEDVSFIIKQLTKTNDLNRETYFEISRAGLGLDLLDVVNELRQKKINFLTSIVQRISIETGNNLQSFIISVINQHEIFDFLRILSRQNGNLRIKDSNCRVNIIQGPLKCAFTNLPIDSPVEKADRLPVCIKSTLNQKYHKFLPSVLLVEFLQELKVSDKLSSINGITLKYLSTPRIIDKNIILRITNEEAESEVYSVLQYYGNTEIETLLESQILAHRDVWAQCFRNHNAESSSYILNNNVISNDLFTNGRDVNSLLNRLGPRAS
ncbi:unnamed protein product [Chironomus riparius]|uniref:Uncharacterized protein n=1 Tax=Chironomus riparius TaxID=315576 RepID=A0A9N9RLA0_9DIPT|nr:unnamed protein product [Chironomus riparius]